MKENNPEMWKDMHNRTAKKLKNDIDENGHNHYDRVHIKKLNDIDENGYNFYERQHIKNYESGKWTKPEDKSALEYYRWRVFKTMKKFKNEIEQLPNFDKRGHSNKGMYHLDHNYSIIEGFKNNISPEIIGHICNLEMIIGRNNIAKGRKCSITLEDLNESINNYK